MINNSLQLFYIHEHCTKLFASGIFKRKKYIILDISVGVLAAFILIKTCDIKNINSIFVDHRTKTKTNIEQLLKWLMGNPAGLKLNHELSYVLGSFFLYHVHVWIQYLYLIEQYLSTITTALVYSNLFGLTCFLALVKDVLNLLTFHLFCFYVYAAKIYALQLTTLMSLQRLFRGKKWNVKRLRYDSLDYDTNRLIVGTLLFTILIFLLPTTALYYFVFAAIRVLLLIVHLSLDFITAAVNGTLYEQKYIGSRMMRELIDIVKYLFTGELIKPWKNMKKNKSD